MRIKQLDVIGFKSFAQRTVIDFPSGITAIVGPNGCGKSNVVDAIRWVLGEQSPRHLRGESMEDVVFKGNDRVPASGMAQVSLTFENDPADRPQCELDLELTSIPEAFRGLTEIMVTRRYFRSGESEYFINKTPCRLKDITELFLGTGVGTKAYAIIEQGRVEQLINAKPEDRRLFIEEAAGTTLYRSRKLAAERKMERTRENLLRVSDVLRELDRQIQYLHRLAKKAEQYRSLQEEIRQLDLSLSATHWRRLGADLAELEADLGRTREREAELQEALARLESDRSTALSAHTTAEEELARCREATATLEAACQNLQQRSALLRQQAAERERRRARLEAESLGLTGQQQQLAETRSAQEEERTESASVLVADQKDLLDREAELAQSRELVAAARSSLDEAKNRLVAVAGREAECRNVLAVHGRRRDEAHRRLEKLTAEQAQASEQLQQVEQAAATRRADVDGLRSRLSSASGEQERRAARVRSLAEQRRHWERSAAELKTGLVQAQSHLASLQDLQRNHEGYQRGVRAILQEANTEGPVLGVVADVLNVPEQYERAVAAALGDRLQYVIVRGADDGVGAVSALREQDSGRGSFIPLAPRKVDLNGHGAASLNGTTRRLIDLVNVEEPFREVAESLLSEVVLVPDLQAGLSLWRDKGTHATLVTPEGDTIDAAGVITGGSEHVLEESIVSRRRVLGELSSQVAQLEAQHDHAAESVQTLAAQLGEEEQALKNLDRDVHALTLELVAAEKDLERLEGERPRWLDRLEVSRFEAANTNNDANESSATMQRAEADLVGLAELRAATEAELTDRQGQLVTATDTVERSNTAVTALKVRVAERRQRLDACAAALARLDNQIRDLAARAAAITTEIDEAVHEHGQLQNSADEADAERTARLSEREAVDQQTAAARTALSDAATTVAEHDGLLHAQRNQLDDLRTHGRDTEVAAAEKRMRIEHLAATTHEKYAVDLDSVSPTEEVAAEAEAEAAARLEALRQKIARIGEVNVGAIEELRELEERAEFLRSQKADLEQSLADLERTIQRLNRASRTKFAETFAAVNEHFQRILPQLFRGGEARLVLTDEHNLLETGVDIVVRPPGKKLDSVALLSGGEKALVAVSLIFSLFLINPTPFCFLDEVDAPLDDANVGRFTGLVRQMSERSQFIVITHNKRTMQAADVLYGVTMEEPGISKLISVALH